MKIYATERGIENLKREINEMREHLNRIREDKADAYHNMGDTWHDNPAFTNLEQDEKIAIKRLVEHERRLASVELYTGSNVAMTEVAIGSIVHLHDEEKNTDSIMEITGHGDSDPFKGKVRYDSPLASAIMGAKQDEYREFKGLKKIVKYRIVAFFESWEEANEYKVEQSIK